MRVLVCVAHYPSRTEHQLGLPIQAWVRAPLAYNRKQDRDMNGPGFTSYTYKDWSTYNTFVAFHGRPWGGSRAGSGKPTDHAMDHPSPLQLLPPPVVCQCIDRSSTYCLSCCHSGGPRSSQQWIRMACLPAPLPCPSCPTPSLLPWASPHASKQPPRQSNHSPTCRSASVLGFHCKLGVLPAPSK